MKGSDIWKYTSEQQTIFNFIQNGSGHGIIDAVAGSGKTSTIMECSKYVPDQTKALFCAFNKSIALEIGAKLRQKGFTSTTVRTIHSLGYQILRQHLGKEMYTRDDKYKRLLRTPQMRKELTPYYKKLIDIKNGRIGNALINSNTDPLKGWVSITPVQTPTITKLNDEDHRFKIDDTLLDMVNKFRLNLPKDSNELHEMVRRHNILTESQIEAGELKVYSKALTKLLDSGNRESQEVKIMDFTDMLYLPYIWNLYPLTTYDFLFVDECQDLSRAQLRIVMKFANTDSRVMAVGDPYQAIYGFAGADAESFARVKNTFKATQFPLTMCFRCPEDVVTLAKEIRSDINGLANKPGSVHEIEYSDVSNIIKPGDLIIARTRDAIILLMFDFIDKAINVSVHPTDAEEVISDLRALFKPDELATCIPNPKQSVEELFTKIINRNEWRIKKEVERMNNVDTKSQQALIDLRQQQLRKKVAFINKLFISWQMLTIDKLFQHIYDVITSKNEAVKLSSIHRAKGLENDRVFIIEYDKLPWKRPEMQPWEELQERNLKYVALTRAKQELYLVKSEKNNVTQTKGNLFDTLPHL